MEKQINILKAKLVTPKGKNKEGWHLEAHWEETIAGKTAKDSRECPINPHPDLITAFQRLARHVAALTDQYNDEGQIDSLNVEARGYSLSGEDEKEGIIITGVRKISGNRTIVLNTPLLKWGTGEEIYEDITKLNADIDACNKEVLEYLFKSKYATDQPGELFHTDNVMQELDEKAPTAYTNITNVFVWTKLLNDTLILPRGVYDGGLKEKCRDKIIEAGGEQREDNDLIYDFKESPADFVKKQSRNKNKYLQFAEA